MTQAHATPEALFAFFDAHGVAHATTRHEPVFTVAESAAVKALIPGVHSKNLFLKDKKGALTLLSAAAETAIDLAAFAKAMGHTRYSFGSPALLLERLGVTPGSVTAFAAINDREALVHLALDAALLRGVAANFHPLRNDATTSVTPGGLMTFYAALGRSVRVFDFDASGVPTAIDAAQARAHVKAVMISTSGKD